MTEFINQIKEDIKEYFPYCHCGAKMGGKHD